MHPPNAVKLKSMQYITRRCISHMTVTVADLVYVCMRVHMCVCVCVCVYVCVGVWVGESQLKSLVWLVMFITFFEVIKYITKTVVLQRNTITSQASSHAVFLLPRKGSKALCNGDHTWITLLTKNSTGVATQSILRLHC